ncbi:MAG: CHAT domain-containing protein [Ekhidna sp.]
MKLFHILLASLITFSLSAQYAFESKKTEKFYFKMEDAWLDYDYQKILESEDEITATFLYNEDTVAANMYSFLGESYYYELDELQKALDYYNSELELRKKIQPNETNSEVIALIAMINNDLGNYSKSETLLKEVVRLDKEKYGSADEIYFASAMSLAELYIQIENPLQGLEVLNDLKKDIPKNTLDEVGLIKSIGDCHTIEGSYKKGEKSFKEALSIAEQNGLDASFEYASTLNSLAGLYEDVGKLPEAEEAYGLALSVIDRLQGENEDASMGISENKARIHFGLGDFAEAIKIQRDALAFNKDYFGTESFNYGISLNNLGRSLLYSRKYSEAEQILKEAIPVFELSSSKESIDVGRVESLLSLLYTKVGRIDEAITYGKKAISTYDKVLGNDNYETAYPKSFLADAYLGFDEVENAEPLAIEAYDIRRKTLGKNHPLFAKSANQMAIISWKKGETKDALKYYKETFDNYFAQINAFFPVLTEEEKTKFYYTNLKPGFEQYISFIEDNSSDDKELIGEIYNYQLALKGIIMSATTKVRNKILNSDNEDLIAKYQEWIGQKEKLAKLFSATDMDVEERNSKIQALTASSNTLEQELSKESDVFGKNFANRKLTWQDVQKKLKPGEAAVEIVRYKDFVPDSAGVFTDEVHYAALIIKHDTEDHPEFVIIRNGKVMEKKYLANYRNAIRFRVKENYSYKFFWRPIGNNLKGIKKVYFSPDGVYNQVSVYTFRNPETNEYLIEEFDLQVVTNTKDLLADNGVNSEGGSVFFGYPNYNLGTENENKEDADNRGMRGMRGGERGMRGEAGKGGLERGTVVPRGVRGNLIRYMKANNALALLPGTKKEVELIDSLYQNKSLKAETYYSNAALENKIKELERPSTLHIATHGFFLEIDPDEAIEDSYVANPLLRSGLIMAGANSYIGTGDLAEEQGDDDGILTAFEAMNLDLDGTEIVVLSACETGLGDIKNGEGVYGLQRAFRIAGAEALIMSMWSVDDNATQELMTNFYEEWLTHGDKSKAFITAQKRLKAKYPKPFYWGAFVMVGY